MKRPSFQFYPGDWLRDAALRSCSVEARGLWIDMLCLMHDGTPYGYLRVSSKDILPTILARIVGASLPAVEGYLLELESAGVFSREGTTIFSRRMIRDEEIRTKRAIGGHLSTNNPNVPKKKDKTKRVSFGPSFGVSPSSSSSSSSAVLTTASQVDLLNVEENGSEWHPTTMQLRFNSLYGRKAETRWDGKMLKAYRSLGAIQPDDISAVERYYAIMRKGSQDKNYSKRDLATLLNNFWSEVERARMFKEPTCF